MARGTYNGVDSRVSQIRNGLIDPNCNTVNSRYNAFDGYHNIKKPISSPILILRSVIVSNINDAVAITVLSYFQRDWDRPNACRYNTRYDVLRNRVIH